MSTITVIPTSYASSFRPARSERRPAPSAPRSTTQPAGDPVRLTRRGKAVVLGLAASVIALLAIMMGPSSTATDQAGTPDETTSVRVLTGQTLWQIAAEANPDGDIRATVDDIIELNSLPNASALQLGSEIAVPVYQ